MGHEETGVVEQAQITIGFLEQILKKKIIDFKASGGSNPGDNYTSILISLEITLLGAPKPLHLLFKTFPNHPTRQKLLEDTNLFLKEYQIYNIWLPELLKFQTSIIGNETVLKPAMPEFLGGAALDYTDGDAKWNDLDPMLNNFVLMVDVRKTLGFKMANKLKSLGYHHVKVVLDELAKYHSLCYAYKVHNKLNAVTDKYPFIEDPFFCNPLQRPTMEAMLKMNMELIMETLANFFAKRPDIAESVGRFKDPVLGTDFLYLFLDTKGVDEEKVESLMRVKPKKYADPPLKEQWIVVGHGDCWTNNMLFKGDENGKITDTVLVDLQIARESCIMADIVYFIYSSTDTDFRERYLEEMMAWYHERFVYYCGVLKVDPFKGFTLQNFKRKFHRSKIFGFLFASVVLPIILQKPETTVNMDSLDVDENCPEGTEFAQMLGKMGRDDEDTKLLEERFTKLVTELYEEGVL